MRIPAKIKEKIEDWLKKHPAITKQDKEYQLIVSRVKEWMYEIKHPDPEVPLDWIEMVITTSKMHRELHKLIDKADLNED